MGYFATKVGANTQKDQHAQRPTGLPRVVTNEQWDLGDHLLKFLMMSILDIVDTVSLVFPSRRYLFCFYFLMIFI